MAQIRGRGDGVAQHNDVELAQHGDGGVVQGLLHGGDEVQELLRDDGAAGLAHGAVDAQVRDAVALEQHGVGGAVEPVLNGARDADRLGCHRYGPSVAYSVTDDCHHCLNAVAQKRDGRGCCHRLELANVSGLQLRAVH